MPVTTDVADREIITTPRTIFTMISILFATSAWVLANIITTEDFKVLEDQVNELSDEFAYHIEESTVWRLESRLEDVSDQRWLLRQRMNQEDGDTAENRARARELEKREQKLKMQIDCLRDAGRYCLSQSDRN